MKIILLTLMLFKGFASLSQNKNDRDAVEAASRKTVSAFFDSFGEKNPDKIASFIAEDVDWYIYESKYFPWTGKRSKRSEIPQVFKTLFSYFVDGKEQFKMEAMLVDGNDVAIFAVLGRQFKLSGKSFTMPMAMHIKVENGLITKFYLYEQTKVLEKAFKK
ncbi:MAG: nuclear transport factor 2 family protein [Flavobacterium sp.]|nr:nuclear transport factor 2 family protein [Flavobacterium sp.]